MSAVVSHRYPSLIARSIPMNFLLSLQCVPSDGNIKDNLLVVPHCVHRDGGGGGGGGGDIFALTGGRQVFFDEGDIPGKHHSFVLTLIGQQPAFCQGIKLLLLLLCGMCKA